jgi:hypothetical protein
MSTWTKRYDTPTVEPEPPNAMWLLKVMAALPVVLWVGAVLYALATGR